MRSPDVRPTVAILAAVLASCGPGGQSDGAPPEDRTLVMGHATFAHEVRSLRPCGGGGVLWVVDSAAVLWNLVRDLAGEAAGGGAFAVIRGRIAPPPADGFGADHGGTLTVEDVLYVAREGLGCDAPWDRFAYRAVGNEPFWSLTVSGDSLQLARLGSPQMSWRRVRRHDAPDGVVFDAGPEPEDGGIRARLVRSPCRDTMVGSYYGFTATVRVGRDTLAGCALPGRGT